MYFWFQRTQIGSISAKQSKQLALKSFLSGYRVSVIIPKSIKTISTLNKASDWDIRDYFFKFILLVLQEIKEDFTKSCQLSAEFFLNIKTC